MRTFLILVLLCGFGFTAAAQQGQGKVTAPETFTPNADGQDDTFKPIVNVTNLDNYIFLVLDSDKQVVFRTKDKLAEWGGMNLQKNKTAEEGTYTWKVTYQENGQRVENTGTVTLKR